MYSSCVFLRMLGGGALTTLNIGFIARYFQVIVGMLEMTSRPPLDLRRWCNTIEHICMLNNVQFMCLLTNVGWGCPHDTEHRVHCKVYSRDSRDAENGI